MTIKRAIPKDHKGLYSCPPYNHGKQEEIIKEKEVNKQK
jgi:hypothetical protein